MFMYEYQWFLSALRALRTYHNAKQETVAAGIGMERTAYCRREKGEIDLTVRELIDICNYYNVSPSSIFTSLAGTDEEARQIIDLLNTLPDEERRECYRMIRWAIRGLTSGADKGAEQPEHGNKRNTYIAIAGNSPGEKDRTDNPAGSSTRSGRNRKK
jgi:transcriptional regulator with XRE-family HTH domain